MTACLTCLAFIAPYCGQNMILSLPNHDPRVVHRWGQWAGTKALPGPGSQDRRRRGDPGKRRPSDSVPKCTEDNCWCWASLCPKIEPQHWRPVLWVPLVLQWPRSRSVEGWTHTHRCWFIFLLLFVIMCEDIGEQRCYIYLIQHIKPMHMHHTVADLVLFSVRAYMITN